MLPEYCRPVERIATPTEHDWPIFLQWANREGWRVPAMELALYREDLADSAFVLRDGDARPLGFVTVCRQRHSAWIGNLIVDPARRGTGLGRRLFRHALAVLADRGAAALWLTASPGGRPLYEACGFRAAGRIERWLGRGAGTAGSVPPAGTHGDLYTLVRADAAAWGESRAGLLTLLARGGQIFAAGSSIALLQPGSDLRVLGPWLSADCCPRSNRTILASVMEMAGVEEIAVDVLGGTPLRQLLAAAGFRQTGETVLMMRGAAGSVRISEVVALASLGSLG